LKLPIARPLGQVGLAEDDRTSGLQRGDGGRVGRRHVVAQGRCTTGGADVSGRNRILDRDGQTVQWPPELTALRTGVCCAAPLSRGLHRQGADRVDLRVDICNAGEEEIE